MDANVKMKVRANVVHNYSEGSDQMPMVNIRGEQITSQGLPANAMLVNIGGSFMAKTATAAAPVIAIPTTAALLGLWNGDQAKSYVIDSVFVVIVAATGAVQAMSVLANVSVQPVLTALANTVVPIPMRANRPYNGAARVAVGITLDAVNGVAANWVPFGSSGAPVNTTQVGQCIDIPINGSIILPPNGQLALSVLSGAATASSVQLGVRWHELVLPPVV